MRVSTQFTVSIHILLMIEISKGQKVTSDMISESAGCNPVMARQLFGKLKEAGILNVSAGRGATELAKDPSDITLWNVFEAIQCVGTDELFKFHSNISHTCKIGVCFKEILGAHLDEAVQAMSEKLSNISLAQLMDELCEASYKEEQKKYKHNPYKPW